MQDNALAESIEDWKHLKICLLIVRLAVKLWNGKLNSENLVHVLCLLWVSKWITQSSSQSKASKTLFAWIRAHLFAVMETSANLWARGLLLLYSFVEVDVYEQKHVCRSD